MKYLMHKKYLAIIAVVVVVIIGAFAMMQMPQYKTHALKSKGAELVHEAESVVGKQVSAYMTGLAQTIPNCTALPDKDATGTPTEGIMHKWAISKGPVGGGSCVVTVTSQAIFPNAAGSLEPMVVTLTPTIWGDSRITWTCSTGGNLYAPATCP